MPIRIATLCGMGFGTSLMLKLFIEDLLKEIGMKAEILPWDLGTYKGQKADIIIAPLGMKTHLKDSEAKVILMKSLVDRKELREKLVPVLRELEEGR